MTESMHALFPEDKTPIDLHRQLTVVYQNQLHTILKPLHDQKMLVLPHLPKLLWQFQKEKIVIHRKWFGLSWRKNIVYGTPYRQTLVLRQGEIGWQRNLWQRRLQQCACLLPELLFAITITCFSWQAAAKEISTQSTLITAPVTIAPEASKIPHQMDQTPRQTMQQTPWQTAWEEANRLFQNGNFEGAEQKLTLITADNPLFQAAKKLRAETIYNQAMQALQENRLSSSLKDCQRSLQLEPTDERIMNLRTQLLNQAKALFMRGYLKELSSPKEAKQIYEEVMERLNPIQKESELNRYWLRAQERLANL